MIELLVRFKEVEYFYISAVSMALCILWAYYRRKNISAGVWPLVVLNFSLFIAWGVLSGFSHDDVAFLHFSWMISQGLVPFRDFWEHHSPLLAVVMAPLVKSAPHSPAVFDIARIVSGAVFVVNALLGWRIAKQVWQSKARLSVYLLMVSGAGIIGQYLILRPDIFLIFLMLAAISISLDIPRKGPSLCLVCGIACGLAMAFITKQYLLVFLPIIAVFFGNRRSRAPKLIAYAIGFGIGIMPFASYLLAAGIAGDFLYWVIGFNSRALYFSANFPVVFIALGTAGASALMRSHKSTGDVKALILFYALVLSTLSSLTKMSDHDSLLYYLGLWYFICAIAASGAGLPGMLARISSVSRRVLIAGIVSGLILFPNVIDVWKYRRGDYVKDRQAVSQLMAYTRADACVILLPIHPVFAIDATRLYSSWQFLFVSRFDSVRRDAIQAGIAQRIIKLKPAVVMARLGKRDFILEMYQRKLITSAEYKELIAFIKANYSRRQAGKEFYYIRADVLDNS